jgi:hypothetical protein
MTKEEEIKAWEVLLNTLTEDSYTFGYVVNQLPFIKDAIQSDVSPDVYGKTVEEYHREMVQEAKDIVANAEAEAQDIVCKAKAQAELIREQIDKAYQDAHKQFAIVANNIDGIRERL